MSYSIYVKDGVGKTPKVVPMPMKLYDSNEVPYYKEIKTWEDFKRTVKTYNLNSKKREIRYETIIVNDIKDIMKILV